MDGGLREGRHERGRKPLRQDPPHGHQARERGFEGTRREHSPRRRPGRLEEAPRGENELRLRAWTPVRALVQEVRQRTHRRSLPKEEAREVSPPLRERRTR